MKPSPRPLVFGLLLGAEGEALSVRDLINACRLFGVKESSVRVALVRMSAEGLIRAAGRGSYELGEKSAEFAADIASWRDAEKRVRPNWNGDWIAVPVGGLGRSDRSALRSRDRALALLGLRELEDSLYIRPDNLVGGVTAVRERLHKRGLDRHAPVFVARQFDEAREKKARELWNGGALTRQYRETRLKLERWLEKADNLETEAAARESYLLGREAIRALVFDPLLPAPLVDVDERRRYVEAVVHFDRAGHLIWQQLRSLAPATDAPAIRRALRH